MNDAIRTVSMLTRVRLDAFYAGMPYHINAPCQLELDDGEILRRNYKLTDNDYDMDGYGVYVLFDYDQDVVLYVGKTNNIARRLIWWFWHDPERRIRTWYPEPAYLLTITLPGARAVAQIERFLIDAIPPKYNDRLRPSESEIIRRRGSEPEGVEWWDGAQRSWGNDEEE
jgi:hypothetical protein